MRFQRNKPPKRYARRNITKFLLFPKTIDYETRWLETATYEQCYGISMWYDYKWISK